LLFSKLKLPKTSQSISLYGGATKIIFKGLKTSVDKKSSSKYFAKKIHHIECHTKITLFLKNGNIFSKQFFQDL